MSEPQTSVRCAHETCGIAAMCRIKTKTGIANLCWRHYEQHYADQALANLDKYGLARLPDESKAEWVERMRQFVRTGFRRFADRQQRERKAA